MQSALGALTSLMSPMRKFRMSIALVVFAFAHFMDILDDTMNGMIKFFNAPLVAAQKFMKGVLNIFTKLELLKFDFLEKLRSHASGHSEVYS